MRGASLSLGGAVMDIQYIYTNIYTGSVLRQRDNFRKTLMFAAAHIRTARVNSADERDCERGGRWRKRTVSAAVYCGAGGRDSKTIIRTI